MDTKLESGQKFYTIIYSIFFFKNNVNTQTVYPWVFMLCSMPSEIKLPIKPEPP